MKYLIDFFHQKVPKTVTEMPEYFKSALVINEELMSFYFLLSLLVFIWKNQRFEIIPIILLVLMTACLAYHSKMSMRANIITFTLLVLIWTGYYVYAFGWACGGQHMLLPLLVLSFFNIYNSPRKKLGMLVGLLIFRMVLFDYSIHHISLYQLDSTTNIIFQTINSITLFLILAIDFIIFGSSIQDTERELRLNNQELHKEADTDPLTGLANRRGMLDMITFYREVSPDMPFCVAIGDIDYFKKVNDTYGHNCGDYTLKELARLFRERSETKYETCRWGGEEFCFFLPNQNLDQAWNEMFDLCEAVRKMKLSFEGNDFSITITIGIEENDFHSPIETILDKADKKLYMGKVAGRNRVVM
ncbi:MAG: GGDEF domain-containing protein [Flexilinea sp.]|nr:GGDEF domain-containing protein [Flexilinea sp.]